jgi:hypothetical protein
MIEQFLESGLRQQSEQREAFYYVISHKSLHRTQRRTTQTTGPYQARTALASVRPSPSLFMFTNFICLA